MMKLYALQGACPFVPHVALVMTQKSDHVQYEIELMSRESLKSAEYLALNPQGSTPFLTDGDFGLSQNIAILYYLDKKYPNAHIFGEGCEQCTSQAVKWLAFLNSDVHKAFAPIFNPARTVPDEALYPAVIEQATVNFLNLIALADQQLAQQDFLTANFTVADAYLYVILRWATFKQVDFSQYTHLTKFIKTVEQNEFILQALKEQNLTTL